MTERPSPIRPAADRGRQSGQALAELAIVVTLILVMALAVFDLGLAFYNSMLLTQGARDGARVAMDCNKTIPQIQSAALAAAPSGATVTVAPSPRPSCPTSQSAVDNTTVTVNFTHTWITPFWGGGGSVNMAQDAVSR